MPDLPEAYGFVAHVVVTDPEAHQELIALCAAWHRKKRNSLYVAWEQSKSSWDGSQEFDGDRGRDEDV